MNDYNDTPDHRLSYAEGTIRFSQTAPAEEAPVHQPPTYRVHNGITRQSGDGQAVSSGFARYTGGADPRPESASVAGTVRRDHFSRVDFVTIPGGGGEVPAKVAETMGLIRREGDRWVDVAGAAEQLVQPREQQEVPESDPAFDRQDLEAWAEDIKDMPQGVYDSAVASAIAAVSTGGGNIDRAVQNLYRAGEMDPTRAREYITEGIAMHERAADRALLPLLGSAARVGEFREYLNDNPMLMKQALEGLVYGHDTTKLLELATKFQHSNPPDLSAWKAMGFEATIGPKGEVLVRKPGRNWVPAKDMQ